MSAATGLDDPFYDYTGNKPLKDIKPGSVLNTREIPYSIQGLGIPLETVQLFYRTTDQRGRAVVNATTVVRPVLPIGLIGYSGGAIASEWAAELLPARAPAIARRVVGTAIGGVFVHPGHNLAYVEGSSVWAGVIPMALVGVARSFGLDLAQYATPYGKKVMKGLEKAIITQVLGQYDGLKWSDIVRKKYKSPRNLKVFVKTVNKLIMGTGGTPNSPMFIGQGTGGDLEGTPASKKYGAGDAVMVTGDVRSLARKYCHKGVTVKYSEYPLSHFTSMPLWLPEAYAWLLQRFAGGAAPTSCGSIAAGNSLAPMKYVRP